MSAPAIKPGTRCECTDHEVYADWYKGPRKPFHPCDGDAVRLVTVPYVGPTGTKRGKQIQCVPMCSPCAAHAEKGGTK